MWAVPSRSLSHSPCMAQSTSWGGIGMSPKYLVGRGSTFQGALIQRPFLQRFSRKSLFSSKNCQRSRFLGAPFGVGFPHRSQAFSFVFNPPHLGSFSFYWLHGVALLPPVGVTGCRLPMPSEALPPSVFPKDKSRSSSERGVPPTDSATTVDCAQEMLAVTGIRESVGRRDLSPDLISSAGKSAVQKQHRESNKKYGVLLFSQPPHVT